MNKPQQNQQSQSNLRIGVLGGGQLGQMIARAGQSLAGHTFRFLDPSQEACAASAGELIIADYNNHAALDRFASGLDLVTYEFENVPLSAVEYLQTKLPVRPGTASLRTSQDRLLEKQLFTTHNVPTAPYRHIQSLDDLEQAVRDIGVPGVLKARSGGYDGRGQFVIHDNTQTQTAFHAINAKAAVYEQFIPFQRELSLVAVRSTTGQTAFYPLVENVHRGGILITTTAPAPNITPQLEQAAQKHVADLMHHLDHVGVFTVEFFEHNNQLIANETACRVHNTGHWTIEGARTSQFENHVRAITGQQPGDTSPIGPTIMLNLIGIAPSTHSLEQIPGATVHLYGKQPRPGRKLGHVTLRIDDDNQRRAAFEQLTALAQHAGETPE